jgi:hypothetical protein
MTALHIDSVIVGERHRVDLGDIDSLAKSIEEIGLLHPIVVTPEQRLIAGQRRIEAFRKLGRERIPVTVVDMEEVIRGEWAENAERKPFTPSEAVAIGRLIEESESAKARAREHAGHNQHSEPSEKIPEGSKGDTRDIVGAAVGMSGATYSAAKRVVTAAEDDPEIFGPIKEEMDRTGKVQPADDKVRQLRQLREATVSHKTGKTKVAVATRREHIIRLGKERHQVSDIANKVGVGPSVVTQVLREEGIELVSDRIGKMHRPEANKAMEGIVSMAMPAENAVALVEADWAALDRASFPGWADELHRAIRTLSRLEKRLRKELE